MLLIEIALITPPVGLNPFVIQAIAGTPLSTVVKGVLPFVLMMLGVAVLLALFPQIALWLPGKL